MINLSNTDANHNYDEGFDFDEQGKGDIVFNGKLLEAASNLNEGIKVSEENGGSVRVLMHRLINDGGMLRLYRGYGPRLLMQMANGGLWNWVYVQGQGFFGTAFEL